MNRYLTFGRISFLIILCFNYFSTVLATTPTSLIFDKFEVLCDTTYYDTLFIETCQDRFSYNGVSRDVPGFYKFQFRTSTMCDSFVYLNLIKKEEKIFISKEVIACTYDTVFWRNRKIVKTAHINSAIIIREYSSDCDTLFELRIHWISRPKIYETKFLCGNDSLNWQGSIIDKKGIYYNSINFPEAHCTVQYELEVENFDKLFHNWKLQSATRLEFEDHFFFNSTDGVGITKDGIYSTSDGGIKWNKLYQNTSLKNIKLFFLDEKHGWVTGKKLELGLYKQGYVLFTKDGGVSWDTSFISSSGLNDIIFIDEKKGWVIGDNGFIGTTWDGGITWTLVQSPDRTFYESVSINKTGFGIIVGSRSILITFDYGANWQQSSYYDETHNNRKIKVFENGFIYLLQDWANPHIRSRHTNWEILYSTDFGQTWKIIDNSRLAFDFYDVLFLSPDQLIIIGEQGKVYYSNDRGENFYAQEIDNDNTLIQISGNSLEYVSILSLGNKIFRPTFPLPTCDIQTSQPNQGDTLGVNEANLAWNYPTNCVEGFKVAYQVVSDGIVLKTDTVDAGSLREVLLSELPYNSRVNYQILPYNANGLAESCDTFFFYTPACRAEAAQVDTTICQGDTLKIYGFALSVAGTYELNYRGENNCDSILPVQLRFKQNVLTSVSEIVQPGTVFNGVLIQSDTSFSEIYPAANGCDSIVSYFVKIIVGTHQVEDENTILKIIPNPNRGVAKLEIADARQADFTLKIFDLNGKNVWTKNGATTRRERQTIGLDIENLAAGFYWIEFAQENIKQRLAMVKL